MTIKASGRSLSLLSVWILATGLFVCFARPLPAAAGADDNGVAAQADSQSANAEPDGPAAEPVKHHKRARHASRHHKSGKVALKSSPARKNDATDGAENGDISTAIPLSVANANAELATTDTPDGNAQAMTARANDMLQLAAQDNVPQAAAEKPADAQPAAETQVLPSDQLNDVDRTLHDSAPPPAPVMTMAAAEAPATPAPLVAASSDESSTTDETSLIGKIFIGFGALLTMASAARMFMA